MTHDGAAAARTPSAGTLSFVQGLRAVAVVLVVAFHAGAPLPGGYVGVDVFFGISVYRRSSPIAVRAGQRRRPHPA